MIEGTHNIEWATRPVKKCMVCGQDIFTRPELVPICNNCFEERNDNDDLHDMLNELEEK